MAENYLITGYWGVPHVTSENDRGINAAIFGAGRFVLPVGEQFRAEYIGNNTVRIYDGKLIDNGAVAGIPAGEYVDLLIPEAGQGMNRNDLIIFQYAQDPSTLIESGVFMVLSGEETSGTATDPALTQEDLLTNEATLDQMALWRVPVSGTVISAPVQLFGVTKNMINAGASIVEATSSDGVAYSATVPGITELYAGLEVTIIPNMASASTAPTLNINGLGAKNIRLPVSTNTAILAQPETETYFVDGRPVRLMYDPKYAGKGSWVAVHKQRQSGSDIYGTVPVEKGGTGADNAAEALANLGALPIGGGKITGTLEVGNNVRIWTDGEGGNIRVVPSDSGKTWADYWEIDSYDGGLRFYTNRPSTNTYGTGVMTTLKLTTNGAISVGNAAKTRTNLEVAQAKESTASANCYYRVTSNGNEWINPPMVLGTEYLTTERWEGKPVYVQLVNFGTMPKNTNKTVTVSYEGSKPTKIIYAEGIARHSGGATHCPLGDHSAVSVVAEILTTSMALTLQATTDFSSWSAMILLKYVK